MPETSRQEEPRRPSLFQRVAGALAFSVVLVLAAGTVGIIFASKSRHTSTEELKTVLPAQSDLEDLLSAFINQETGERGYVITSQASFLQPYNVGRTDSPGLIAALRKDVADRPSDLQLLSRISKAYNTWLTSFAESQIDQVAAGQRASAFATEKSGKGKDLFDALRKQVNTLEDRLDSDAEAVASDIQGYGSDIFWLVIAVSLCALAGALLAFVTLRAWVTEPIRRLDHAVRSVKDTDIDRVLPSDGPSEIASLSANIDAMRLRIRETGYENRRLRQDAELLQTSLLPRTLPVPPGFEIITRYVPGADANIGGDWYNVRAVTDEVVFFAMGDVMGHGLSAAATMALFRFGVNAHASVDPQPNVVMNRLANIHPIAHTPQYATLLCCLYDVAAGELSFANAGHPNPVVINNGVARQLDSLPGPPIGLGHDSYDVVTHQLERGSVVLAFTDGLIERRNEIIDIGIARLLKAASNDLPLSELVDHVIEQLIPEGSEDDVALLAIAYR